MPLLAFVVGLALQGDPWTKVLSTKASVRLLSITDIAKRSSWEPNGNPVRHRLSDMIFVDPARKKGQHSLSVAVVVDRVSNDEFPTVEMKLDGSEAYGSSMAFQDVMNPGPPYVGTNEFNVSTTKRAGDVLVKCATGKWQLKGSFVIKGASGLGLNFKPKINVVTRSNGRRNGTYEVTIVIPKVLRNGRSDFRVTASDSMGVEMDREGSEQKPGDVGPTKFFFTRRPSSLQRLELQVRPFEAVTFKSVNLRPSVK